MVEYKKGQIKGFMGATWTRNKGKAPQLGDSNSVTRFSYQFDQSFAMTNSDTTKNTYLCIPRDNSDLFSEGSVDVEAKHNAALRFFNENLADENGKASGNDFSVYLTQEWGFQRQDPRFTKLFKSLMKDQYNYKTDITADEFLQILIQSGQTILLQVCIDLNDCARFRVI